MFKQNLPNSANETAYYAFDIETREKIPESWSEAVDEKGDPEALEITCICIKGTDGTSESYYDGDKFFDAAAHAANSFEPTGNAMRCDHVQFVIDRLVALATTGNVASWNGCGFDGRLLRSYARDQAQWDAVNKMIREHYDLMFSVVAAKGFPVSLKAVLEGCGLSPKSNTGLGAVTMWANGQFLDTIDYCLCDCDVTLTVLDYAQKRKSLSWLSKAGKKNTINAFKLMSVQEACKTREPDTSWMREPIGRETFVGWLQ